MQNMSSNELRNPTLLPCIQVKISYQRILFFTVMIKPLTYHQKGEAFLWFFMSALLFLTLAQNLQYEQMNSGVKDLVFMLRKISGNLISKNFCWFQGLLLESARCFMDSILQLDFIQNNYSLWYRRSVCDMNTCIVTRDNYKIWFKRMS